MLILLSELTWALLAACAFFLILWALLEVSKPKPKNSTALSKGSLYVDRALAAQMDQGIDPSLNVSFQLVELSSNVAIVRHKVELLHQRLDDLEMRLPETSILTASNSYSVSNRSLKP
jgi:hypothetical protein